LKTKTDQKDQQPGFLFTEQRMRMLAEFMNVQRRGIEDVIGKLADRGEQLALLNYGLAHRPIRIQRMGSSRFAEAAHERSFGSLQKPERDRKSFLLFELVINCRKF